MSAFLDFMSHQAVDRALENCFGRVPVCETTSNASDGNFGAHHKMDKEEKNGPSWKRAPLNLVLARDFVHIWRARLDPSRVAAMRSYLSSDELDRAEHFRFQKDRERFIVARGVLRAIIGRYTSSDPSRLSFRYGAFGKPCMANDPTSGPLRFNLAHCHGVAVYAVARDRSVGIDLEYIRPLREAQDIADAYFAWRESRIVESLLSSEKLKAFFRYWTRKEAYAKACGDGLQRALSQFDTSLVPCTHSRLVTIHGSLHGKPRWSLMDFVPDSGYVAALVVEGCNLQIELLEEPIGP